MGFYTKARVQKIRTIARIIPPPALQIFPLPGASLVVQCGTPIWGRVTFPTGASMVLAGGTPVLGGAITSPTGASVIVKGGTPGFFNLSTLWYYDPASIVGLNDGDGVGTWTDTSGNSHDATEATNKPLYKTAIFGSLPAVYFDTTAKRLTASTGSIAQPFMTFMVATQTGTSGSRTQWSTSTPGDCYALVEGGSWKFFAPSAITGTHTPDTSPHVICVVANNTTSQIYIDGALEASGNTGADGLTNGLVLGNYRSGDFSMLGYMGDFFGVSGTSSTDRALATAFLGAKYGITVV